MLYRKCRSIRCEETNGSQSHRNPAGPAFSRLPPGILEIGQRLPQPMFRFCNNAAPHGIAGIHALLLRIGIRLVVSAIGSLVGDREFSNRFHRRAFDAEQPLLPTSISHDANHFLHPTNTSSNQKVRAWTPPRGIRLAVDQHVRRGLRGDEVRIITQAGCSMARRCIRPPAVVRVAPWQAQLCHRA